MKKQDSQKEFEEIIRQKKGKQIRKIMAELFSNIEKSLDFLNSLVSVASSLQPQNTTRRGELIQLVKLARQKFASIPISQAKKVLLVYYEEVLEKGKKGLEPRYLFEISNILGGSGHGEIEHSKKIIRIAISLLNENPIPSEGREQLKYATGLSFLSGIIALTNIVHTWENCIEAFSRGDGEAEQSIKDVIKTLAFLGASKIQLVPSHLWNPQLDLMWGCPETAFKLIFSEPEAKLPIPSAHALDVQKLIRTFYAKLANGQKGIHEITNWFRTNFEVLEVAFARMWTEIINSPKYDVRLGGCDRVAINISELKSKAFDYKELQFIREEYDFPQVRARYWLEYTGLLCNLNITLRSGILKDYRVSDDADYADERTTVDLLLSFIAMHCYWKIVTGEKKGTKDRLGLAKIRSATQVESDEDNSQKKEGYVLLRPKFRRLPEGHKSSEQAGERALEVFGRLPYSGFTFVKEHERGIYLSQAASTKPIFAYLNSDLGY
jgi:hypothetical protein